MNQTAGTITEQAASIGKEHLLARALEATERLDAQFAVDPECADAPALLTEMFSARRPVVGQPPVAAQRLLRSAGRPGRSFNQLTSIIKSDPALTQGVLKMANSAMYSGVGVRSSTIAMGVQRIGTKGVEAVVLSQIAKGLLCRPGGSYDEMVEQVWEHMVRVGPLAKTFAPAFGVKPEEAYTLGILHDVGKLVFFDHMTSQRRKARRSLRVSRALVNTSLRNLHEILGGLACVEWGLDDRIIDAISIHHGPARGFQVSPEAQVIYVAERFDLARQRGEELDLESLWEGAGLSGSLERASAILANLCADGEEVRAAG